MRASIPPSSIARQRAWAQLWRLLLADDPRDEADQERETAGGQTSGDASEEEPTHERPSSQ